MQPPKILGARHKKQSLNMLRVGFYPIPAIKFFVARHPKYKKRRPLRG
jgi:hypothetical protein